MIGLGVATMPDDQITIYTIGLSKKDAKTSFGELEDASARSVIDLRLRNT